jgi:cysteinyl-tRNA synthetase
MNCMRLILACPRGVAQHRPRRAATCHRAATDPLRWAAMLRLYDTRTRQVEPIRPRTPGLLRIYACGPTVYRDVHVGNLRAFLLHDLIARVARYHSVAVRLVQNITDVGHLVDDAAVDATGEDKILQQARAERLDPLAIARHYEQRFHAAAAAIGLHPADHYPRASESIELMFRLIDRLIHNGHAYVGTDGSVYFDARSFPGYGAISGNRLTELRAGHRIDAGEALANKRFHADWALWKRAGAGRQELVWDSPWGSGFPGWHIECSAMSLEYLGEHIDIHTGGIDLRFPHHEDERAQSDAVVGHEVVHHWVHGEHLLFEGRKMAKSTGNVVQVSDVEGRGYDPLAVRLAFLQSRYRQQANLSWDTLAGADRTLARWRARVAEWAESPSAALSAAHRDRIVAAFDDDLDTPAAVIALRDLERDESVPPGAKFETFAHCDRLFGLDLVRTVGAAPPPAAELPAGAADLLDRRAAARAARDWPTSDRLRAELAALGVAVVDTAGGQEWTATATASPADH